VIEEVFDLGPQADDVADYQILVHAVQGCRGRGPFALSSLLRASIAVGQEPIHGRGSLEVLLVGC
jgi:hypothetical protein